MKVVLFVIFLCFTTSTNSFLHCEQDELNFHWSLMKLGKNGTKTPINLDLNKEVTPLNKSDIIWLYFNPISNLFLYVFLDDSDNELNMLFLEQTTFYNNGYLKNTQFYLPNNYGWTFTGNSGEEKFIVLVSKSRLFKLEKLVDDLNRIRVSKSNSKSKHEKSSLIQSEIIKEITLLRRANSSYIVEPEKQTPMAGAEKSIGTLINEVKASTFYARTIKIKH